MVVTKLKNKMYIHTVKTRFLKAAKNDFPCFQILLQISLGSN